MQYTLKNMTHSHDQSTSTLQHFSMIAEELKNFTNKVSSDIKKISQAYNTAQAQEIQVTS